MLSNSKGEILGGHRRAFSSALQSCPKAATPQRRFGRMDNSSWQLLSAGNCHFFILPTWLVRDKLSPVQRAIKVGGDSRFDKVKHQPGMFLAFWMAQGLFLDRSPPRVSHTCSVMGLFYWHASLSGTFLALACFCHEVRFTPTGECSPPAPSPRLILPGLCFARFIC